MKVFALMLATISGCAVEQPIQWSPRVLAWKAQLACPDYSIENSARISIKEPEFCRSGSGFIFSLKGHI